VVVDPCSGIPLSVIGEDSDVIAPWRDRLFLVLIHVCTPRGPRTPHSTQRHLHAVSSDTMPIEIDPEMLAFPLTKRTESQLSFVSIGRLAGNDIVLPSESVSKFHAYVKPDDAGVFALLQDGRSSNGTFVEGERVHRRGEGPPTLLRNGSAVRFANLSMVTVDAEALLKLAHTPLTLPAVVRAS
jgi:pSer/pThr/pTyr-binding forkhead associated (FHA) protein